jgi:hypothetical protein
MDDGNIHRIFVVEFNSQGEPIPSHVIAQRDVLRFSILEWEWIQKLFKKKIN